tara:strand:- start:615 stop:998 length:384 start_codon:yes stop_codon:yes gene_type:complete
LKSESKLWQKVKKNTPGISWSRIESWASFGFPDLVGYTAKHGFFTMELKVTKSKKITFSPHQIAFHVKHPTHSFILVQTPDQSCPKLYTGAMVQELVAKGTDACCLPLEAWGLLLEACSLQLDAWSL